MKEIFEYAGHATLEAADGKAALDLLKQQPVDLMLLDLDMPRLPGIEVLRQVAAHHPQITVIIISGKEMIARAIHHNSARAAGPFVTVNCAAIPDNLIESELFGHERGSFTGAQTSHRGKFEQAHAGTLFLDEIGDMSLMMQAKTLRALNDGTIDRLGGEKPIAVEVRVIAATNKNLETEMEEGNFRGDLFYRLNVIAIHVPPLRQRREDIPDLVDYFLALFCNENGLPVKKLARGALTPLVKHDWPGNVRQLRNVMERLVVLSDDETISPREVAEALKKISSHPQIPPAYATLRDTRAQFEREFIINTLIVNNSKIQETAAQLGIERTNLWKKMKRYGIEEGR